MEIELKRLVEKDLVNVLVKKHIDCALIDTFVKLKDMVPKNIFT